MIDDMALLKQAMEQMDAEDPVVAQAAKDRAAQALSDARLSFSKMADLLKERRLLLRPRILTGIKRMDQPGMLGEAAFRDTGSALRKDGQSFGQIAEAIEHSGARAPGYDDPVRMSERPYQMASMPGPPDTPAWLRALGFVASIIFFPLLHPIRFLAIALVAILLFYGLRGCVGIGQQASGYFDGVAAIRQGMDKATSSVSSFINDYILRRSREEAAAPPTPPASIPSPPAALPSPQSATPSAPPAAAPAPSAPAPAAPAPPSAAPAPGSAAPARPLVATPRRDARGDPLSRSPANRRPAREDCDPCSPRFAPFEDDRPRAFEPDRPRTLEDLIPERLRRNSRTAGPCVHGIGGCRWGGGQY
jgi:hypothetical protein